MFCIQCGQENPENTEHCHNCGSKLSGAPFESHDTSSSVQLLEEQGKVTAPVDASTRETETTEDGSRRVSSNCPVCGVTSLTGATVCDCGHSLVEESVKQPSSNGEVKPAPYGIGGWLLLFCIGTAILSPLADIVRALTSKNPLTVVVGVVFALLALYTGVTLWRQQPNALDWVRVYFEALLVLGGLTVLISLVNGWPYANQPSVDKAFLGGARTVFFAAIWWLYFTKSKRVRNTFGRNL